MRTVIHRNRTFEYNGEVWCMYRQGPYGSDDSGWYIYRDSDGAEPHGAWSWYTLDEIRDFVDEARNNNWDLATGEPLESAS